MPTMTERVRLSGAILIVNLISAPSATWAGDRTPTPAHANPFPQVQILQPAPVRPVGPRWPDNPLRRRRAAQPLPTVWWVASPVEQPGVALPGIPKEFLDAIRYQIAQARRSDAPIQDDELFARSAATLRALKGSAPTDAELSEIRSLVGPAPSPARAAPTAQPVALMPAPLPLHICNRFCRHR